MPRFRYKHIQSGVEDRAPQSLLDGEIAVNKFAGKEKLFIKNTDDEIIPFISETQIDTKINSAVTNINSALTEIYEEMDRRDECKYPKSGTSLYGVSFTNVGMSCDESAVTETTTVNGERIIIDAVDGSMGLTATENMLASAEGDIVITADDYLCVNAGERATFYGLDETHIGASCDGLNKSASIIYERNPSTASCITSTTVDEALDEVLDKSKIHVSRDTQSGASMVKLTQGSGACGNEVEFPASLNIFSAVTVSSNLFDVTCPPQILGANNTGAQAIVIYENIDENGGGDDPYIIDPYSELALNVNNTEGGSGVATRGLTNGGSVKAAGDYQNYVISVADIYKTPLGQQIVLVCPVGGYCEVSYLNINGKIYARGGNDYCGNETSPINNGGNMA